jgi:hypothetical protein
MHVTGFVIKKVKDISGLTADYLPNYVNGMTIA